MRFHDFARRPARVAIAVIAASTSFHRAHNETRVVSYDEKSALFFSSDFPMPRHPDTRSRRRIRSAGASEAGEKGTADSWSRVPLAPKSTEILDSLHCNTTILPLIKYA